VEKPSRELVAANAPATTAPAPPPPRAKAGTGKAEAVSIVVDIFCGATGKTLNGVVSPPPDPAESEDLPASPTTRRITAAITSAITAGRRVLGFLRA